MPPPPLQVPRWPQDHYSRSRSQQQSPHLLLWALLWTHRPAQQQELLDRTRLDPLLVALQASLKVQAWWGPVTL
jgi:hypothetical protein